MSDNMLHTNLPVNLPFTSLNQSNTIHNLQCHELGKMEGNKLEFNILKRLEANH